MQPAHPTLPSVALLALLALAGGRGAHAMVDEASKSIIHEDPGLRPIALACLGATLGKPSLAAPFRGRDGTDFRCHSLSRG